MCLLSFTVFSQTYVDTIAIKSCECSENLPDTLDSQTKIMKFGLCIMENALPYQDQLKADYGIDFKNIDQHGEYLGQIVGLKMGAHCSETLMSIVADELPQESSGFELTENVRGVIERINTDHFVKFYVRRGDGELIILYWISPIETELDLPFEYRDLEGSELLFHYDPIDIFDPRIDEYRTVFVISRIED